MEAEGVEALMRANKCSADLAIGKPEEGGRMRIANTVEFVGRTGRMQ